MLNFICVVSFADLNGIIYTCRSEDMRKCLQSGVLTVAFVTRSDTVSRSHHGLMEILRPGKKKTHSQKLGNPGIQIPEPILNLLSREWDLLLCHIRAPCHRLDWAAVKHAPLCVLIL